MKLDKLFMLFEDDGGKQNQGWRFRRKLIFAGFRLGALMILFGMAI